MTSKRAACLIGLLLMGIVRTTSAQEAGRIYVLDTANKVVIELDGTPGSHLEPDGGFLGVFGETEGNLSVPVGLALHPTSGNLFVSEVANGGEVLQFDSSTGAFLGSFGDTQANLILVRGLVFSPFSGHLFVADVGGDGDVKQFDGSTGAFLGSFGETADNVSNPIVVEIHPVTGNLLALDCSSQGCEVLEFDATTGGFLGLFGPIGDNTGSVTDMTFDANGDLLVTEANFGGEIKVFDDTTGDFVEGFGGFLQDRPQGIAALGDSILVTDGASSFFGSSVAIYGPSPSASVASVPQAHPSQGAYNFGLEGRSLTDVQASTSSAGAQNEKLHYAQFGNGTSGEIKLESEFRLTNGRTETASGTVKFFDAQGNPFPTGVEGEGTVSEVAFTIPPMSSIIIETTGEGTFGTGTAVVCSDIPLGGVIQFTIDAPAGIGSGTAAVPASQVVSGFIAPARREGGINTGLAIKNVRTQTTTVELSLRSTDGVEVASVSREIVGGGQLVEFISTLFGDGVTQDFVGTVVVKTPNGIGMIAGTALEQGTKPGEFTTLPVTPLE